MLDFIILFLISIMIITSFFLISNLPVYIILFWNVQPILHSWFDSKLIRSQICFTCYFVQMLILTIVFLLLYPWMTWLIFFLCYNVLFWFDHQGYTNLIICYVSSLIWRINCIKLASSVTSRSGRIWPWNCFGLLSSCKKILNKSSIF